MSPLFVVSALTFTVSGAGCTHDFSVFEPRPNEDSGLTTSTGDDAQPPDKDAADAGAALDSAVRAPDAQEMNSIDSSPPPAEASPPIDSSTPAEDDSSCGSECKIEATGCAGTCAEIEESCAAACAQGDTACTNACTTSEDTCTATCVTNCATCTSQAGCIDQSGCAKAAP